MKRLHIVLISVFLSLLLVLTGCGKEEAECQISTDCPPRGDCFITSCQAGQCVNTAKQNCCGNNRCEESAGESICSCEADCGTEACEGKIQYENPRYEGRFIEATYAEKYCEGNTCVVGVSDENIEEIQVLDESTSTFDWEIVTTYSEPYVLGKGKFQSRLKVLDYSESRGTLPVRITGVQVLTGSELIAEKSLNALISSIGETYVVSVDLDPVTDSIEDSMDLILKISYEYAVPQKDGTTDIERTTMKATFRQMMFVDPTKTPK